MLFALPLIATAAASAHYQMTQSSPITVGTTASVESVQDVGSHRSYTVALNRDGGMDGRVVSLDSNSKKAQGLSDMSVRLVKKGVTVARGTSTADGVFSLQNVPLGVYSFIASGENGFSAYSVRVVPNGSEGFDEFIESVAVSRDSISRVRSMLEEQAARPTSVSSAPYKERMDEKSANRVVLNNGVLSGRLMLTKNEKINPEDTLVHILKNGVSIKTGKVNEEGQYEIPGMQAGVYAFVAVGPQGVAVVAFEAVDSDGQTQASADSLTYVSTAAVQDAGGMDVYLVDPQDTVGSAPVDSTMPIEYASEDIAYGGAYGSCGSSGCGTTTGGGGGGGGGGGIGRGWIGLAGLAGLAGLGGGNNPNPGSPTTPVQ